MPPPSPNRSTTLLAIPISKSSTHYHHFPHSDPSNSRFSSTVFHAATGCSPTGTIFNDKLIYPFYPILKIFKKNFFLNLRTWKTILNIFFVSHKNLLPPTPQRSLPPFFLFRTIPPSTKKALDSLQTIEFGQIVEKLQIVGVHNVIVLHWGLLLAERQV